ncbi:FeoA family protein [Leptospirillum ferriphilum]|uniref:FeoA family protein n=1 Tax=Leptospirillum ferriphilum TaxID=178606 RepID=UPI000987A284|nr:FeoA family protein [Leptospirillum ferriphilum]OOH80768.1 hypothetical protein BOX30_05360 [Leptospirillum ferriphilum]
MKEWEIKKILMFSSLLFIFLFSRLARAQEPADYYQKNPYMAHHMQKGVPGCLTRDLLRQFLTATVSKDDPALKYLTENGCILFRPDVPITVLEIGPEAGPLTIVKVRGYVNDGNTSVEIWTFRLGLAK